MEYNDLQKSLNETPILMKKQNSPHNWLYCSRRHHSSLINYPCEKYSGVRIIMDIKIYFTGILMENFIDDIVRWIPSLAKLLLAKRFPKFVDDKE